MVGVWHGDGRDIENRAAASSTGPSRSARPQRWPPPWSARGLHRDLRAPCCRTRPQRRPFDPDGAMYQTGPKRGVCGADGGRPMRASVDAGQHAGDAQFGQRHLNGHDFQADHRDHGGECTETTGASSISAPLARSTATSSTARARCPPPYGRPGTCTGIYVVRMDDEIGGGDEVSEDDVVTASGTARGKAAQVTDASDRCWGTRPGTLASELGARCSGRLP